MGGLKKRKAPLPTVDVIIEYRGGIVLIERKNYPWGWAIPGGFVDYGESLEKAAVREIKEETNLKIKKLWQFHTYSSPRRDPRQHTISTVFVAQGEGHFCADSDAKRIQVFKSGKIPRRMAFDHQKIIKDYFQFKKRKEPKW